MTIHDILATLQASHDEHGDGGYHVIPQLLADEVWTSHEPPFPDDPIVWDGEEFADYLPMVQQVMSEAFPDRRMEVSFTARGDDEIAMTGTMRASMPDGSPLAHPVDVTWTFENGRMTRYVVAAGTPEIQAGYAQQGQAMAERGIDVSRLAPPEGGRSRSRVGAGD